MFMTNKLYQAERWLIFRGGCVTILENRSLHRIAGEDAEKAQRVPKKWNDFERSGGLSSPKCVRVGSEVVLAALLHERIGACFGLPWMSFCKSGFH